MCKTEGVTIVRAKNRFHRKFNAANECAGYRDLQFNVLVDGTELIWELQVHLEEIEIMKTKLTAETDETGRTGHQRYVAFRAIRERLLMDIM